MWAALFLLLNPAAHAGPVVWQASRAQAVEAARNSGKLILLLAGRDTCGNCQYMKNTACESPSVRSVIDANYVAWYCLVDSSTEWYAYASGLGTFTLPLICVIDPADSMAYLDRSTNIQDASYFRDRLKVHLPTQAIDFALIRTTSSRLRWTTETGFKYRVQQSADLAHWTFLGNVVLGTGSHTEFSDGAAANRCFYRIMGFK
jgi:hypothetical protein